MITDDKLYTLQYTLYNYINQASSLKALVNNSTSIEAMTASLAHASTATSIRMTVTIVVVTPIILIYPIFQRFFTKGIMIGAVKGCEQAGSLLIIKQKAILRGKRRKEREL